MDHILELEIKKLKMKGPNKLPSSEELQIVLKRQNEQLKEAQDKWLMVYYPSKLSDDSKDEDDQLQVNLTKIN